MCSPLAHPFSKPTSWTQCNVLLTEISSKSSGFIKWWPKCLNLNVTKASQWQSTCEAITYACLHPSNTGLFTSPSLNRCPFIWLCPASNPIIIHSWFLLRLSNSPAFFRGNFLRQPLVCLCSYTDCQCSCVSYLSSPWSQPPDNLCSYTKSRPMSYEWMWRALSG